MSDDLVAGFSAVADAPSAPPVGETPAAPASEQPEAALPDPSVEAATSAPAAPASPAAAPDAPPAAPAIPEHYVQASGWLQQQSSMLDHYVQQMQQAAYQDQVELQALQRYGALDAYNQRLADAQASQTQREAQMARVQAAQAQLSAYNDQVQMAAQRAALEPAARMVVEHAHHESAKRALGAAYNGAELSQFLSEYTHPPSLEAATKQYVDLKRQQINAGRVASGVDQMGGAGPGASATLGKTSAREDMAAGLMAAYRRR